MVKSPRHANNRSGSFHAVAVCTPGLEAACMAELSDLGLKPKPDGPGAVRFRATLRELYSANVWLRSASRVLVRVASFRATDFAHLEERSQEIDWSLWCNDGEAVGFRVTSHKSALYHTDAIAERLHRVIGPPGSFDEPAQQFTVRIVNDVVTISIDSSGEPLHHRPWRQEVAKAPLRTSMAAAVLRIGGWTGVESLADPFCGSGTIAIEAALAATGRPSTGGRRFQFQQWPNFSVGSWASVQGSIAAAVVSPPEGLVIEASDRDAGAIGQAQRNAERAGVADLITFRHSAVSELATAPPPGFVVTNPPYGKRIGGGDLRPLYQRFGEVLRVHRQGWNVLVVANDAKLISQIDPSMDKIASFGHGGTAVGLYRKA